MAPIRPQTQLPLATLVLAALHGAHWLFYALLLSYAVPPVSAGAYAADGVLVLWIYAALVWTGRADAVLPALVIFGDTVVAAEALDVYRETQRSLTQGRATMHLVLLVYSYLSVQV